MNMLLYAFFICLIIFCQICNIRYLILRKLLITRRLWLPLILSNLFFRKCIQRLNQKIFTIRKYWKSKRRTVGCCASNNKFLFSSKTSNIKIECQNNDIFVFVLCFTIFNRSESHLTFY